MQNKTVSQGTFLRNSKKVDTTPAIDGTSGNLEVEAIEDNDRDEHGVDGFITRINGKCKVFFLFFFF